MNEVQLAIQAAVAEAGHGRLALPKKPFLCLAATRIVLERAFKWPSHELYEQICKWRVDGDFERDPQASDLEYSMKQLGYTAPVSEVRESDLVFGALPDPEGHVGIVFRGLGNQLWVFENATVRRKDGRVISGANQMVPLRNWERITTVGRFPADFLKAEAPIRVPALPPNPTVPVPVAVPAPAVPDALVPQAPAVGDLPWVQVRDRNGQDVLTEFPEATYYGVVFRRVPGGVELRPDPKVYPEAYPAKRAP